ncbi:hypothetical protein GE191_23360 [Serratia fonticola]|uniref:hypothetical protein n=1 Tax=Serratia fonticola TaxID=47917 RepID=UPI0013771060|nr:hypothetical protein [Serratia fonticola]NBJ36595.1 hypothetical protein [Serratia fonticola]
MNADRRKRLSDLFVKIEIIKGEVEDVRDEEQDAFDSMPEGLQQSERGQKSEMAISCIEEIIDGLEQACDQINEAII